MTKRPTHEGVEWDAASEEPILGRIESDETFNPLDTENLAIAVTKALLVRRARPLGRSALFNGAGIYAIYYSGAFAAYELVAAENRHSDNPKWPIYVGKAVPAGGRKELFNLAATDTTALFSRLRQHADSVSAASNLSLSDFTCRYLVVQDLWIPLAEALLISHFSPIWNRLIEGFGNHDPGAGRYGGMRPRWDVLHPGRAWAMRCEPRPETEFVILSEVANYLAGAPFASFDRATFDGDDK